MSAQINLETITREQIIDLYKEGKTQKEVCKILGMSEWSIKKIQKRLNIDIKDYLDYRATFDIHVFDVIDTEEKAYWLGFLYADGCVATVRASGAVLLGLNSKDLNHLKKFQLFMKDTKPDRKPRHDNKWDTYQISYYNTHLRNSLIRLGCVERKSLILKFPDMNIFKNENLVYDFIRGYVDGDGCISTIKSRSGKNDRIRISLVGTKDFLEGVRKIFPEFKTLYYHLDKRHKNAHVYYSIEISCSPADNVAFKLYEHATIYLDRKYEKYATLCRLHNSTSETSGKNGEDCDVNTVLNSDISEGSESV